MPTTKEVAAECMHMLQDSLTLVTLINRYRGSESSSHKTRKSLELLRVRQQDPDSLPTIETLIKILNDNLPDEKCNKRLNDARVVLNYHQGLVQESLESLQEASSSLDPDFKGEGFELNENEMGERENVPTGNGEADEDSGEEHGDEGGKGEGGQEGASMQRREKDGFVRPLLSSGMRVLTPVSERGVAFERTILEKTFHKITEGVACLYSTLHEVLHPDEKYRRPRTPTRDHGDFTWEGLGSIEFKTFESNNAFGNLIEDCSRHPAFHLWPQVQEALHGSDRPLHPTVDVEAPEGILPEEDRRSKSWKSLAQMIGHGLLNRAGITVCTDLIHHWVIFWIPIECKLHELHEIPIHSYAIKDSASIPSCLTALVLLFYDQVLSKDSTSIFPEYAIFDRPHVNNASSGATNVAAGNSTGMGPNRLHFPHYFQRIVSSLKLLFQSLIAAAVFYLFTWFKPDLRDSKTGTVLFVSKSRYRLVPSLIRISVFPQVASRQGAILYPTHHAFAVKVFTHADDFAQELRAYKDLSGLPGIPELLAFGISSNGQRFIVITYVGKPVSQVTKSVVQELWSTVLDGVHARNYHHHDLRAKNIVRNRQGKLSLIDFADSESPCTYGVRCPDRLWMHHYGFDPKER